MTLAASSAASVASSRSRRTRCHLTTSSGSPASRNSRPMAAPEPSLVLARDGLEVTLQVLQPIELAGRLDELAGLCREDPPSRRASSVGRSMA